MQDANRGEQPRTRRWRKGVKGVRYKSDADIADYLEIIKQEDEERFFAYITRLPIRLQAETIMELPGPFRADLIARLEPAALADLIKALETDEATDFMQLILHEDSEKAEVAFEFLDDNLQQTIRRLMTYSADEAGSLMQTEVFTARVNETIQTSLRRLRRLKSKERLKNAPFVLVVDGHDRLLRLIPLTELIAFPTKRRYSEILDQFDEPQTIMSTAPVEEAARTMERYDLTLLPVVDRFGHLLGCITHDDVVDLIEKLATEQMYGLGQVGPGADIHESTLKTGAGRAFWLGINLFNVTLVSLVIGLFESALGAVVALAILMPIVANMAGTASIQTLTVIVRQMALGELTARNGLRIMGKELRIAAVNGTVFGLLATAISYVRFGSITLGLVMASSIAISFVAAGLLGAGVPVLLERLHIDPAVASATLVITLMDVIAFVVFLGLATVFIVR